MSQEESVKFCPKCGGDAIGSYYDGSDELIEVHECASCGCKFSIW